MPAETIRLADGAIGSAIKKLMSARINVNGRRLPLAGTQRDPAAALGDLRAAQEKITETIRLIERWPE